MKLFKYKTTPVFIIIWFCSLWILHSEVVSQSFLTQDAYIDIDNGELIMRQDYLGHYLSNKKIGYSHFILKEDSSESAKKLPGKYFLYQSDLYLRISLLGTAVEIKSKQTGEVNEDLSLRAATTSYEASGQRISIMTTVDKNQLLVTTKSEGNSQETKIPISSPVYTTDIIHLLVARGGLEIGSQKTYPVYDAMTMSMGDIIATVEDKETVEFPNGETTDAYRLELNFKGYKSTAWINKDGDIFKEKMQVAGISFTSVREKREDATNMSFVAEDVRNEPKADVTDLIKLSSIKTKPPISNPQDVTSMKIELTGAKEDDLVFDTEFQQLLEVKENSLIVQVKKLNYDNAKQATSKGSPPYETTDPDIQNYLKDEPLIQSSHPRIRDKALEITAGSKTEWEACHAIALWLYREIDKEIRVTIPSALELLNTMKGDCNEHSTLFAALARSIGIPAKICAGLVYQDDGFYYHAWNEVNIGGKWYPIDSTLNRIEMDAAHIKLAEGSLEAQVEIAKLIGMLGVNILELKYNE